MAAQIISLAARFREPASRDWSSQELAEFYRVESALLQAGLALETDRGLSDEGDPWFVFCRVDTGEVFIHFARVDGGYVVDGAALGSPARGRDFGALVRDLISRHPLTDVRRPGSNIHLHPAAILIALVGAAFFHSSRAKAAEPDGHHLGGDAAASRPETRRGLTLNLGSGPPAGPDGVRSVALDASEVAAVLTGVAIGLRDLAAAPDATTIPADATLPSATAFAAPAPRDSSLRMERSASAAVLGGLAAADARAALTVMAVFHDLARSIAAPQTAPAVTAFITVAGVAGADASPAAAAASTWTSTAGVTAPLLLVHLASGPLPQIEALALVAADGALARVSPDRVVHVDQLPSLLSYLISHGEIVSAPVPAADPAAGGDPSAAAAADHGAGAAVLVDTGRHPETNPAPAEFAHDASPAAVMTPPPETPAPPVVHTDPAPVVTAPAAPHPTAYDMRVDAAVQAFVTQVTDVQVMISEHDVVFYDPRILSALNPDNVLDSITWRLEDGSTVSLVGTVPELHAAHGVG